MAICYPVLVEPISLYLHIPFCVKRCGYCDFNTYAGMQKYLPEYITALIKELTFSARSIKERIPVHTVFFGGGTPSLLSIEQLRSVLAAIQTSFDVDKDAEISLEANPGTVTPEWLEAARETGVNRLSFGVQSSLERELRLLSRIHTREEVVKSILWARQVGFNNLNLDLIFGLPGQTIKDWQQTVQWALGFEPQHLSLYSLIVEEGTPLAAQIQARQIQEPDEDLAADMYEWCMDFLPEHSLQQYEISNWSTPGRECRHNLQYWLGLPYLGFGAGAHGFANALRTENVTEIVEYIQRAQAAVDLPFPQTSWNGKASPIDEKSQIEEFMIVGLRLVREGVSRQRFLSRFGGSLDKIFGPIISNLIDQGLLEWGGEKAHILRLTRRGCMLGNRVFAEFLD